MRFLFRSFWRLLYRNPRYLRYSGPWDTLIVGLELRPARWYNLRHWLGAFRDEWFMYTHPEFNNNYDNECNP